MLRSAIAASVVCAVVLACAKPRGAAPPTPAPAPAVEPPPCTRAERIEVVKSSRSLTVFCEGGATQTFPIALSRERGPKRKAGDDRIPEGEYRIAARPWKSRFHLFIALNYPSQADADRALAEGRITRQEHDAIDDAYRKGEMPPQDTPLGGEIGIHGEGDRWRGDLAINWTAGCIAVSDPVVDHLAQLVRPGTPVRIAP